ncbi:hypothetical protein M3P05_05790 [Sansalvadorimonas sp. 2012CJ34-2]|uniref:Uncharacterized protein n=1 Tax=Parendozoicomonas callyspongiae TaxID=2942213 RepID=A0ABT0PDK4_9GAMM|nr:hypothetical protein [Sansalvadorimonas sp. 2012CJ34-2]MCL6269450.1 hypothetical protein [Sansalvadorimonas sp. 2012CJ34-2]
MPSIEALQAEIKQLKAENKTLQADNPKRMKAQIKRLQDDNRSKSTELNQAKSRLKKAQEQQAAQEKMLQEMNHHFQSLQVLEKPHWESEDKSWAIYLEIDQETRENERPDFNLRVVDRKTGGAKIPHVEEDDNKKPYIAWPRMRAVPKDVKNAIEEMVEI